MRRRLSRRRRRRSKHACLFHISTAVLTPGCWLPWSRAKAAEAKQANYELWAERKRLRDRAVDCLQYIPLADLSSELNKKMAWLNVGKALKGVDPTLMGTSWDNMVWQPPPPLMD